MGFALFGAVLGVFRNDGAPCAAGVAGVFRAGGGLRRSLGGVGRFPPLRGADSRGAARSADNGVHAHAAYLDVAARRARHRGAYDAVSADLFADDGGVFRRGRRSY